jgi:hypothetical protein
MHCKSTTNKSIFLLILYILLPFILLPQNRDEILQTAKELQYVGEYNKALDILGNYHKQYPDDLDGAWLYAQTAYWLKNYKTAFNVYETAIKYHPQNYSLKLDYAISLLGTGNIKKSLSLLQECYNVDKYNTTTLFAMAQIYYWQLEFEEAKQKLYEIFLINPVDKKAIALAREIFKVESYQLNANMLYSYDDQPLNTIIPTIETSKFFNKYLNLTCSLQNPFFLTDDKKHNAIWLKLNNTFLFDDNFKISANAGFLNFSNKNKITWKMNIEKKFFQNLLASARVEKIPYFYTLNSLNNNIFYKNFDFSIQWLQNNNWNFNANFIIYSFGDTNTITTCSGWLTSKPLNFNNFKLKFGYGYNYSSAKENTFVAEKTLSEIINSAEYSQIKGIYNPYFTPYKQNIHSLILILNYNILKKINFETKFSIGLLAYTKNPYLYLDKNVNNEIIILRDYYKRKFTPFDLSFNFNYDISDKVSLKATYMYNKNNFYTLQYISAGLVYSFINEKNK